MLDKDYIFNIPKVHVQSLLSDLYVSEKDVWNITVQEIGEFLQAYSKHSAHEGSLDDLCAQREHLIEELTHVLVCFGMIACQEGLTQSEINDQVRKKAIDRVKYPFDVQKHAPLDQVIKDLINCSSERTMGKIDPERSCLNCEIGESADPTLTCKPLLCDALYYIQQAYGKADKPDQK